MTYSEACPKCGSEEYETEDYGDSFDEFSAEQWWTCICHDCGCRFDLTKSYKLVSVEVTEQE